MDRMVERNPGGRRSLLYLLHRTREIGLSHLGAGALHVSWSALETSWLSADNVCGTVQVACWELA